jgi:hypothetical protein
MRLMNEIVQEVPSHSACLLPSRSSFFCSFGSWGLDHRAEIHDSTTPASLDSFHSPRSHSRALSFCRPSTFLLFPPEADAEPYGLEAPSC